MSHLPKPFLYVGQRIIWTGLPPISPGYVVAIVPNFSQDNLWYKIVFDDTPNDETDWLTHAEVCKWVAAAPEGP